MINRGAVLVRNQSAKIVGRIEDRAFIKEVYGNKHMLRMPAAWAIDCDIFDRVVVPNCFSIHVIDKDTGYKYVCGVKTFREKCQKLNRKFGDQYFLELIYWKVI